MADSLENLTDKELTERITSGESTAFGVLYERYLDSIYRYIYYRIGDANEAEDLTEIVFFRTWRKIVEKEFDATRLNFRPWIFKIAHNLVIDTYRNNDESVSLKHISSIVDDAPSPQLLAEEREINSTLLSAINRLDSPVFGQVIILRFINRLSHKETADILGINEGHVRVLQHRALKKLKKDLLKHEFDRKKD